MAATYSSWCDYKLDCPKSLIDGLEGAPHATTDSDIYNGFYIPKGISAVFTRRARNDIVP